MPQFGFVGPAYVSQNPSSDPEDLCNLYPELIESGQGTGGAKYSYYNRPGLTLLANLGGSGRGIWAGNNRLFVIVDGNFFEVNAAGGVINTYTIGSASGPGQIVFIPSGPGVSAPSSGALLVYDGSGPGAGSSANQNVWYIDGTTGTPPAVISGAAIGCIDGYAVILRPAGSFPDDPIPINTIDGTQFNLSAIFQGNSYDPLQFAIKTGSPDQLQNVFTPGSNAGAGPEELWLPGKRTMEVWYDTGGSTLDPFPFQRVPGAFIDCGLWAQFSMVSISGTLYWLGADDRGFGVVYSNNGYNVQRVSTHAIENLIQSYVLSGSDISDAVGWTLQINGHDFYALTFPTAGKTLVYDSRENLWHRWAFNGTSAMFPGMFHAWAFGQHYMLDSAGNLYTISDTVTQDNGTAITFSRTTPILSMENKLVTHSQLELMFGGPYDGTNRTFKLYISNDGGHSFSSAIPVVVGSGGGANSPNRALWTPLGMGRQRCYRIESTDNQQQNWIDGYAQYGVDG